MELTGEYGTKKEIINFKERVRQMNIIEYGKAICYSGYREGQSPIKKIYPSYDDVLEDLRILEKDFDYIRMYDSSEHCETTLEVISKENINLKVLVGMDLLGEISNHQCSWGGTYTPEQIAHNIEFNQNQLDNAIRLANKYQDIVLAVSAGNESVPEWNENLVSPERVLYFVKQLKKNTKVPVTYCDNIHYWYELLTDVAKEVDVISIHLYPVWLGKTLEEAIEITKADYVNIKKKYPNKQVMITETGWTTCSNGGQISEDNASEDIQYTFNTEVDKHFEKEGVPVFFFEAFDEPWKGSKNPLEPEKHWGYYKVDRTPKKIKK